MKVNVKEIAQELQTLSDEDCFFYNKITGELEYFNSEQENPNDLDIDEIDENRVNIHKLNDINLAHQTFMFWMKERYQLPAVGRFIQYMKQQAQEENDSKNALKIYLKDIFN